MGTGPYLALCFLGSDFLLALCSCVQGTLLELVYLITQAVEGDSTSSLSHWKEVFMTESVLELGERCVNGKGRS